MQHHRKNLLCQAIDLWLSNKNKKSFLAASAALVCCASGQTFAQSIAASDAQSTEEIVISASRVTRSGFTAPTPTTTIGSEDFQARAAANLASVMFEMPSVRPAQASPYTLTFSGGNYINLRGLGNSRTLTLVDGRRFVATTFTGIVDTNVVPSALIQRVEMVTGGASAAWGSDAVAGVTNFIFKKSINGFIGNVQYGQSGHGDNKETAVNLAWGSSFAEGRGELMIAAEIDQITNPVRQKDRSWSNQQGGFISSTINGVTYSRTIATGLTLTGLTTGGVITAANGGALAVGNALRGLQFGPGGSVVPFNYGTSIGAVLMKGGDGGWIANNTAMSSPLDRKNIFARATFDFTPGLHGFTELSYAQSDVKIELNNLVSPNSAETTAILISRNQGNWNNNAFLPTALRNLLATNPAITSFSVGRINTELGRPVNDVSNKVSRMAFGLDGDLGTWSWKAYYTHGETDYDAKVRNQLIMANWRSATDAILVNGVAVCNPATVAALGAAPGCVPANIYGQGAMDPAVRNYVTGTMEQTALIKQDAAGASIQGEPFTTWAGPVSFVTGAEYRKESIHGDADPISKTITAAYPLGGFQAGNPKPISGSYNVKEIFAETVVPLIEKNLDLNAAVRNTDYSISGRVTSWKAGLTFTPVKGFLIRGTQSSDIRAPNFNELFLQSQTNSTPTLTDPLVSGGYTITQITRGNTGLQPEKAKTTTFGFTWQPSQIQGFRASLDFYKIDLKKAISQLTPQNIINGCYGVGGVASTPSYCNFLGPRVNGRLTTVDIPFINLQSIKTSGADLELGYNFPLSAVLANTPGNLSLRFVGSYLRDMIVADGISSLDRAGQLNETVAAGNVAGGPKVKFNVSATYFNGPWTGFVQGRFVGGGVIDANPATQGSINDNRIKSRTYVDTSLQYTIYDDPKKGSLQLYGKINNLFDKDPPIIPESQNAPRATNFVFWDVIGRAFVAGARFTF